MALENTYNFECKQGDDFTIVFTIKQDATTPLDLTGYTARLNVRSSFGSATALIDATDTNGKLVFQDRANGVLYWNVANADTTAFVFSGDDETLDVVYDLEIISSTGKVMCPARGTMTVWREVTR